MYNFWKICFRARNDSTHELLSEMFTVLCSLSLATFPSVHANCWFAGKTRNTKHTCYGTVSLYLQVWRERRTFQKDHRRVSDTVDRSREKTIAAHRLSWRNTQRKWQTFQPAFMLCWTVEGETKKITAQEVSGVTRAKESIIKKPVWPRWIKGR